VRILQMHKHLVHNVPACAGVHNGSAMWAAG
jgi:hypothetical protein